MSTKMLNTANDHKVRLKTKPGTKTIFKEKRDEKNIYNVFMLVLNRD
jgi:hypothetical protein